MRAALQLFTEHFAHEFMEEFWYLQKVARGDIAARKEASSNALEMISNIAQAVLSLAPLPGLPITYMLSKEMLKKAMDLAEKAYKIYEKGSEAYEKVHQAYKLFENIQKLHKNLTDETESKGLPQSSDQGPVDMESMRLLAELFARGLAQRYEHVITDRLDTSQPDKSLLPLARVGARRCFEYLQSRPFFLVLDDKTSLLKQRAQLLNSVNLGKLDKSWRERLSEKTISLLPNFIRDLQQTSLPTLPSGTKHGKGKFTSEGVYLHSAWYDEKAHYKAKEESYLTEDSEMNLYPKYGYAYLESADLDSRKPFDLAKIEDWSRVPDKAARFYQPITKEQIAAYLKSSSVQEAKTAGKTAAQSFHDYLHKECKLPKTCQAIYHEDISDLSLAYGDFSGVDFSGATISGDVTGSKFENAYLVGARFKSISYEKGNPVDFTNAALAFADLRQAKLPFAKLNQADLSFANLEESDLTEVHYKGTKWYKTRLKGVEDRNVFEEQKIQIDKIQKVLQEQEKRMDIIEEKQEIFAKQLDHIDISLRKATDDHAEQLAEHLNCIKELTIQQANTELFKLRCGIEVTKLDESYEEQKKEIARLNEIIKDYDKRLDEFKKGINDQFSSLKSATESHYKIDLVDTLVRAEQAVEEGDWVVKGDVPQALAKLMLDAQLAEFQKAIKALKSTPRLQGIGHQMDISHVGKVTDVKGTFIKTGKKQWEPAEKPKEAPVPASEGFSSNGFEEKFEEKLKSLRNCHSFSIERSAEGILTIKLTEMKGSPDNIAKELKELIELLKKEVNNLGIKDYEFNMSEEEDMLEIKAEKANLDNIAVLLETPLKSHTPTLSLARPALFFKDREKFKKGQQKQLKTSELPSEVIAECEMQ